MFWCYRLDTNDPSNKIIFQSDVASNSVYITEDFGFALCKCNKFFCEMKIVLESSYQTSGATIKAEEPPKFTSNLQKSFVLVKHLLNVRMISILKNV